MPLIHLPAIQERLFVALLYVSALPYQRERVPPLAQPRRESLFFFPPLLTIPILECYSVLALSMREC